jgi:hypothetical protein
MDITSLLRLLCACSDINVKSLWKMYWSTELLPFFQILLQDCSSRPQVLALSISLINPCLRGAKLHVIPKTGTHTTVPFLLLLFPMIILNLENWTISPVDGAHSWTERVGVCTHNGYLVIGWWGAGCGIIVGTGLAQAPVTQLDWFQWNKKLGMSSEKIAKKSYLEFSYLNPSLLLLLFLLPLIIQSLSLPCFLSLPGLSLPCRATQPFLLTALHLSLLWPPLPVTLP